MSNEDAAVRDPHVVDAVRPDTLVWRLKERIMRECGIVAPTRNVKLRLVACDPDVDVTPALLAAARQLDVRRTLSTAAVRDQSLLLLTVSETQRLPEAAAPAAMLYPPSALCEARVWKRIQFRSDSSLPPFACFRPPVKPPYALPAALMSPVFSTFLRTAAADLHEPGDCAAESAAVVRLVTLMPDVFDTEVARGHAFRGALREFLRLDLQPTQPDPDSSVCTYGSCVHSIAEARALLALEVDKLEFGTGDPYFQGQAYYYRYWHSAEDFAADAPFSGDFRPALMLEVVGPLLRVSALASMPDGRVICEPLTPFLHLFAVSGQAEYMGRLVAVLRAVREAVSGLRTHYDNVAAAAAAAIAAGGVPPRGLLPPPPAAPYPLRDASRFSDVHALAPGKLLYEATWWPHGRGDAPMRVCVKFTQAYGADVHARWASASLAPALHACEPLDGGPWCMVIMELMSPPWCTLAALPPQERAAARAVALQALAAAHALELPGGCGRAAHGDCRGVNVLVARPVAAPPDGPPAPDAWFVRFLDFDWAGAADGVAVYPPLMSTAVPWAPDARPGLPLRQAHDVYLLSTEA